MKVFSNFQLIAAAITCSMLSATPVFSGNGSMPVENTKPLLRERPGRDWIEKMSSAMQNLNYTGTFVYMHDGDVEAMKIYHSKLDGVEHERLFSLNGEAREIIRNADSVVCIWPGSKSVIVSKSQPRTPFPQFDPDQLSILELYYQFKKGGHARVAGRRASVIDIVPLDNFRYGYRLWVDAENYLLLRSTMSDAGNNIVEQVMYTDVRFPDSIPLEMFNASITGQKHEWLVNQPIVAPDEKLVDANLPGVEKMSLPGGFELISDKVTPVAGSDSVARRLMYSDGLASFSIFIADAGGQGAGGNNLIGGSSMGAVHAYGIRHDQWHATVVGEVPHATVKMLAETMLIASR